jgi:hypothetical protein
LYPCKEALSVFSYFHPEFSEVEPLSDNFSSGYTSYRKSLHDMFPGPEQLAKRQVLLH